MDDFWLSEKARLPLYLKSRDTSAYSEKMLLEPLMLTPINSHPLYPDDRHTFLLEFFETLQPAGLLNILSLFREPLKYIRMLIYNIIYNRRDFSVAAVF